MADTNPEQHFPGSDRHPNSFVSAEPIEIAPGHDDDHGILVVELGATTTGRAVHSSVDASGVQRKPQIGDVVYEDPDRGRHIVIKGFVDGSDSLYWTGFEPPR